jgi:cytidylate kinase
MANACWSSTVPAQILPHETTLRVRLIATMEDRLREIGRRFNLQGHDAVRKLEMIDHERARFIRDFFQKDVADPGFYDLLINTSHWSMAECADLVVGALNPLRDRAAARRVHEMSTS